MAYTFDDDDPFSAMYTPPAPAPRPTLPSVSDGSPPWDDPERPGFDPGISADQTPAGYADLPPAVPDKMPGGDAAGLPEVDEAAAMREAGLRSLAAQQKARGLYPGEVPAEELAAMRAQAGQAAFGDAFNRLGQRVSVSGPNPRYPSTAKYVGAMLGDDSVSQALGPDGQPMFRTEVVDEPIIGPDGQPMLDPMNPSGPPLTRQVEKQVPVMQRNAGLIGGERDAALRVQEAELDREMVNTSLLQQQAMEQRKLHNAMEASALARRQHAEGVRKTIDDANKAIISASSAYEKADDVDPDRGWGEKGIAAKISAVIAAGLLGFAGMDPFAHINAVINNSIDAQKANIAKRGQAVEHARGRQAAAVAAHEQIRAQIGDEEMQDEAIRISALEAIKAEALAKLQNAGVKVRTAEQAAFMNGLDQQLAEHRGMLELKAATTPATISRSVSPYTPQQQALLKAQGTSALKSIESSGDKAVDIIAKRQEQGRDTQGKIDAEAAKHPLGEITDADSKLLMAHADNTQKAGTLSDLIDDFANDYGNRDIPGRGVSSVTDRIFSPNERADAQSRLSQIVDSIGRLQSGGAITNDEAERFEEWIDAGFGDKRLLQNLKNIQRMATAGVKRSERALPDRLRAQYRRMHEESVPKIDTDTTGATGRVNRQGGGVVAENR